MLKSKKTKQWTPDLWFQLIFVSHTIVSTMLQNDKARHNCHALMVTFCSVDMS
jgi:hypothetical protein